jgi:uncharacterized protein (UPF0335 family)
MNLEKYEEDCERMYNRAIEVQDHIKLMFQDLKAMGYTEKEIGIEITFSLIHEGYRIRDLDN